MRPQISSRPFPVRIFLSAIAFAGISTQHAGAAAQTWVGDTSTDWNDPLNWTTDAFPSAGNAVINTNTGNIATITADSAFTPVDIVLGSVTGTNGRVDHRAGTLTTGLGNWMYLGNAGTATGTYNLADTSTTGAGITGFGTGSGSLTIGGTSTTSGRLLLGNGGTTNGVFNMNTTGTLTTKDTTIGMLIGTNGGDGTFNLENGTVNTGIVWLGDNNVGSDGLIRVSGGTFNGTNLYAGRNGGNGTFTITGGSASFTGTQYWVGYKTGTGVVNVNGGTFTAAGEMRLGGSDANGAITASGTLNVTAGTATINGITLGRTNNSVASTPSGFVNVSGGTLNSQSFVLVGWQGNGATGTVTVNGGTFNVGTVTAASNMDIGTFGTAAGTVNVSSGALNLYNNSKVRFGAGAGNTGINTFTQSGGNVSFFSDAGTTSGGTGYLDMQVAGSGTYTYNLDGGTLTTPKVQSTANGGTRVFNFNGGTLKATTATTTFFDLNQTGSHRANVRNGGAIIDTNGVNVTVAEALVHSNVSGDNATDGGLTKKGTGTLTLTGVNSYTGTTTVQGGTLALGVSSTISNSLVLGTSGGATGVLDVTSKSAFTQSNISGRGTINIGAGKTLTADGNVGPGFSPGTLNVTGNLAYASTTITTLELAGNGGVAGTDSDYINVTGTFSLTGALNIVSYNGYDITQTGVYNLLDAGTFTGDFTSVSVGGNSLTYNLPTDDWTGTFGGTSYTFTEGTGVLSVVPEPASLLLGALGSLTLLARRRRA
ncbi:autotransporter-associated beta strand repeat-containing protein [Luteolibacter sp. LG18]|uniref:beta strand repeat-containing protein n=1 Tax=Luteolibacter sp. LG18 TaxID=2819286 RepID=UPI0030C6F2C7